VYKTCTNHLLYEDLVNRKLLEMAALQIFWVSVKTSLASTLMIWQWEWIDEWWLSIACWFLCCVAHFFDTVLCLWDLWMCSLWLSLTMSDRWKTVVIGAAYRPGAPCTLIFVLFS
jgi:hypothetical protein